MWVYGKHAVLSILSNPKRKIINAFITLQNNKHIKKTIYHFSKIKIVSTNYIKNITIYHSVKNQGFVLETSPLNQPSLKDIINNNSNSVIIILDQISDPQNIGAIIRTSVAFKVNAIIATKKNTPSENFHIINSSAGTFEMIPYIQVSNINNTIILFKKNKYWVFALSQNTKNNINITINKYNKKILILGSEGKGIRKNITKKCDMLLKIPISEIVESLNVTNALAISLYLINQSSYKDKSFNSIITFNKNII